MHNIQSQRDDAAAARFVADVKPAETTFIDRLRNEHAELRERLTKLQAFLAAGAANVPAQQFVLLVKQAEYMHNYEATLRERLALLEGKS